VSTAEQSREAAPAIGRTEQQADDKVTEIMESAEAADEGVEIEKQGSEVRVTKEDGEQIYIGFDKGNKDRSKQGRVISDDPSKYPDRTQTTGGWSGGEKGLAAFIEVCSKRVEALGIGIADYTTLQPALVIQSMCSQVFCTCQHTDMS